MRLYADVAFQSFFITTSITGWTHWLKSQGGDILPVRRTQASHFFFLLFCAVVATGGYDFLFYTFTNAWAPWLDSLTLTSSVSVQLMLIGRRIEDWFVWLTVNTLAAPLHMTYGLNLTAGLYFLSWVSVWHGLYQWRKEL